MDEVNVIVNNEPAAVEPPEEIKQVWIHNWMYSIVPGPNFEIFLAGFCKGCRTAFTQRLGVNRFNTGHFDPKFTACDIPKYGCVGPNG